MPLKLNIGLSKKVGLPNYGSLGASCNVELELDAQLLTRDPNDFQEQVRQAFSACSQAVQDELARQAQSNEQAVLSQKSECANGGSTSAPAANGRSANGWTRANDRPATASQVRAIYAIANQQQLDLRQELQKRFGVDRPEDLSLSDASEFIDALRALAPHSGGN